MNKLLVTLYDIGPYRISLRIRYELRRKLDYFLNEFFLRKLYCLDKNRPKWDHSKLEIQNHPLSPNINQLKIKKFEFTFLNESKVLIYPFDWNNKEWSRLWQFNLHYFEWLREIVDESLLKKNWVPKCSYINFLIDDWIVKNPIGFGDGWHSYTISLRIRNWIWFFRLFPEFITEQRLDSLWDQICWLEKHPEKCHGGNHWLENLISLVIGSLQFSGEKSLAIFDNALKLLELELKRQILNDGGHEERSASYHLILLQRLVELACVIQKIKKRRISWLSETILKMTNFTEYIQLKNSNIPLFNDSTSKGSFEINKVVSFSKKFFNREEEKKIGNINSLLLSNPAQCPVYFVEKYKNVKKKLPILNLHNTGWCFLRPNNYWELVVKYGKACPNHLPSHAHSDILSFDLFYKGKPVIVETGTSVYGNSSIRKYERSGLAHNVMQVAKASSINDYNKAIWQESVEVWDSFRAGRKASYYGFQSKTSYKNNNLFMKSFHDGFENIGIKYSRSFEIIDFSKNFIFFKLIDTIISRKNFLWRQIWHLAPNQEKKPFIQIIDQLKALYDLKYFWKETWYSEGFGLRKKRETLVIYGFQKSGNYDFPVEFYITVK